MLAALTIFLSAIKVIGLLVVVLFDICSGNRLDGARREESVCSVLCGLSRQQSGRGEKAAGESQQILTNLQSKNIYDTCLFAND